MIRRFFCLALAVFAAACSAPVSKEPATASGDALPAAWPRCPEWETRYGPAKGPDLWLTGKQAVYYIKPGKDIGIIRILYEGPTQPRLIRNADGTLASDGKLTIFGRTVDFYGSGNEDPEISTQPVQLTTPGGWTGWFSFDFSSPEHLQGKNIPAFTW